MNTLNEKLEQEYAFGDEIKTADIYQKTTNIQCTVIDAGGFIVEHSYSHSLCNFCASISGEKTFPEYCKKAHLYACYQAERFGGKYIYFCPMSLMHWISPVFHDGLKKSALIGGPVFTYDPKDFNIKGLSLENKLTSSQQEEFTHILRTVPYVSPDRVNALAEMLFITTKYLSDPEREKEKEQVQNEPEILRQQFKISEYIKYIETMEGSLPEGHRYPLDKEKILLKQIARADAAGARETLNELLGSVFFSSNKNFEIVKSRVLELIVLLSRAALEGGADIEQIFGLNYQYINKIHTFSTVDELAYWLSKIITRFTDLVFTLKSVKHADIIYKAVNFINNNFTDKITLDEVAAAVYLSPAYFSKVFKEQTGSSFTRYLNRLRIEESKTLLRNSSIPLVDIAGMVGYEDQSYFSKVFKKVTGSTPGKYRDTRGYSVTDNQEIHF